MTKEEKIKEAYGELYEKCNPDENGWFWSGNVIFGFCKKWDKLGYRQTLRFRPESIQGIENNNGWIKIESEDDLPRESWNYWIMQSDNIISTLKDYWENKKYWNITATHYQPIQKPKPPIY